MQPGCHMLGWEFCENLNYNLNTVCENKTCVCVCVHVHVLTRTPLDHLVV